MGKPKKWEKFIQSGFRMPFYMNLYIQGKVQAVQKITGWNHPCSLVVIEQQMNTVYESSEAIVDYQKYIVPKLVQSRFRDTFITSFQKTDDLLLTYCRNLYFKDYSKFNQQELGRELRKFSNLFQTKFGIYGLPKFTDLAISSALPKLLSASVSEEQIATLTKPTVQSEYTTERIDFLELLKNIKGANLSKIFEKTNEEILDHLGRYYPELYYRIETHSKNFEWLTVSHNVRPMTLLEVLNNLKSELGDSSATQELLDKKQEVEHTKKAQQILYTDKKFKKQDVEIFRFIQNLNIVNESRKVAMSKALLWSYPLFQAIANTLKIDTISLRQLTEPELQRVIKRGNLLAEERHLITLRLQYYTCLFQNGTVEEASGGEGRTLALRELGVTDYSKILELRGRVAQPGNIRGTVRLILSEHEVSNLLPGEVLVTSMTDPNMVPAMKKAGAIVTDEGGITCHAAIVSRELKVPCIIGTKIATKVFKTGDVVDIDSNRGTVTKIL